MSERERRANQGLRTLDDAHSSGRISREEYRLRRRQLLGALCDSHGITARNTLRSRDATQGRAGPGRVGHAAPQGDVVLDALPARHAVAWRPLLAFLCGLALCALLVYWLLSGV